MRHNSCDGSCVTTVAMAHSSVKSWMGSAGIRGYFWGCWGRGCCAWGAEKAAGGKGCCRELRGLLKAGGVVGTRQDCCRQGGLWLAVRSALGRWCWGEQRGLLKAKGVVGS